MFIKAHIRGGYRAAASYLKAQGENEYTRIVHISDPDAKDLDEAFHNMWQVASSTKTEKPLFHFSINPFKDERVTHKQVKRIVEAYAAKCNMKLDYHQYVIVEHILDGRQHFHVILNRVDQVTGRATDPGLYKKKAKECSREMEKELGLKVLVPRPKRVFKKRHRHKALYNPLRVKAPRKPKYDHRPRKYLKPTKPTTPAPFKFMGSTNGWPEAAVIAWESWGKHAPKKFFRIWTELAPPGLGL